MKDAAPTEEQERPIAGRYVIEDVLGRGGMGAVYRVRDVRTGRQLALKRGYARDRRKTEKRQALLEREYHTLAQLAHPRIIEVYDYGVDELGPYYTMELLDGADLDKRGKLPWREACALLNDVASSLAILHSRGLLHRDVSARNVRCTADGRAKLLDFGAMVTMGLAKEVAGTPPFVAPEVLQMQALDARADLFSVGALAYYLFTGRQAYPARRLGELRDVWRSTPLAPQRIVPELPTALSTLTLQLLSLDRSARPQSAAEVMERVCAAAGLSMDERIEVSRAYLATPTLVGREKALIAVRRRMLSLVRGDGAALLLEGAPGSGRSRLLDACVLEAKLLGAVVIRADVSDAASGDWGVATALGTQLLELMPTEAAEVTRLSRHVLGHVLDGLREGGSAPPSVPERSLLLRELRDFILAMSRVQRLLVAVDDVDRIDEPSAALLAALAHKTEKRSVILALTADRTSDAVSVPSLRLLRAVAAPIEVEELSAEQTESLVRSVFGEVAHLSLVAGRVHALSQGNPRAAMELAHHMVDRGLARYQAGSWSLPNELAENDLPNTLAISLATRLSVLSEDARALCELLALADGDPLTLSDYAGLSEHGDGVRIYRALDELVAARVLLADAERYRFTQRGFIAVVIEPIDAERRRALHARLAQAPMIRLGDVLRLAHHLLEGGCDREAVELLVGMDLQAHLPPLPLLERALATSQRFGMPARVVHVLRNAVLSKAPMVLAADSFRGQFRPVLDQLERDSGLLAYRELSDVPQGERLHAALARTQERFDQTPEHERVYPILDAIRELARFSGNFVSLAMQLLDIEFLESLPSIEPLEPLSPSLTVVGQIIEGAHDALSGSTTRATQHYEQVLSRMAEPDRAGFDDTYHTGIRLGLHYFIGLIEASLGMSAAEQRAQLLETDREHRVQAWRVRVAMHLNQGNAEEARKCLRRAELLQLQEGSEQRYLGTSVAFELLAHAHTGDLIGVKHALDGVNDLARHFVGWVPVQMLGQCHYRWLQGDLQGALDVLMPALEQAKPGRHPYFCYIAAAHVNVLSELGRVDEAVERARGYLEACERGRVDTLERWVQLAFVLALARKGAFDEAVVLNDALIEQSERLGMAGLSLGAVYEARARIAMWMGDRAGFERFAERCAREYKKGKNPALAAKFAQLLDEARQNDVDSMPPPGDAALLLEMTQTETGMETVQSRMLECVDPSDRARCALTMLLQTCDSFAGYLYGVGEQGVFALASLPELPAEAGLERWLAARLACEIDSEMNATETADGEEEFHEEVAGRYVDAEGRNFEAIFLVSRLDHVSRIAAVLAMQVNSGPRTLPPKELLLEIANQLVEHADVGGVAI